MPEPGIGGRHRSFVGIADRVRHHAGRTPDAPAAIFGGRTLTYSELSWRMEAFARGLLARGVRRGDRVAALSTPRPEYLLTFLGAARIGAVWVGLNPVQTVPEQLHILGDCRPKLLFAFRHLRGLDMQPLLRCVAASCPFVESIVRLEQDERHSSQGCDAFLNGGDALDGRAVSSLPPIRGRDPLLLVYTSGSSGRPKGVLLGQGSIAHCAAVQGEIFPLRGLRALCNFPISHIACNTDIVAFVLWAGGALVFQERFDAEDALRLIAAERINWVVQVPTMFQMMLSHPRRRLYDTSSLEVYFFGGAPMSANAIHELGALGGEIYTSWGMTEATSSVTYTSRGATVGELSRTVGRAHASYEVAILDEAGRGIPPGEPGEIAVRGPCLMLGYWNDPAATAQAIDREGWLHSGDLGVMSPEGVLSLVGRRKEMFKSGGYSISPREIELAIEAHPEVEAAAVVPVPDELYQEVGHAFVLPRPGAELREEDLRQWCSQRLANYKRPKLIHLCERLPMLSIGKVDKAALRQRALAGTPPRRSGTL